MEINVLREDNILNVEEAINIYKHLLKPNPNFGTDVHHQDFISEGIILIEDASTKSKGRPIRFDCYALILRLSGESTRYVNQHSYEIKAHSIQLINPRSLLSFEDISERARSFVLLFDRAFIEEGNLESGALEEIVSFHKKREDNIQLDGIRYSQILSIYEQINSEFRLKESGYLKLLKSYINQLLYLLKREKERLNLEKYGSRGEQLCAEYLSLIELHFSEKKKVYEYAVMMGISSNHLSEVIQESLGETALFYIHQRLYKEMEYLLLNSALSIKIISDQLNFKNTSSFGRFFKQMSGVSPGMYRKREQAF